MMAKMSPGMKKFFDKLSYRKKIRMFYELAIYLTEHTEEIDYTDKVIIDLYSDIQKVVDDVRAISADPEDLPF